MKKNVGLIGCTGMVGKGALKLLINQKDIIDISLGGRSVDRMQNAVNEISSKEDLSIEYSVVDVSNEEQLDVFCQKCDIVINCAGPFNTVGDLVLRACVRNNKNCVDASGDEAFLKDLISLSIEAENKGLSCAISSGINPGLSEIIPAFVMTNELDFTRKLSIFFLGKGGLSLNATYDIVNAIVSGNDQGSTYSKKGNMETAVDFYKTFDFPEPAGKCMTYPSISEQFVEMTKGKNVDEAYFYNAYADKGVLFQFMKIKAGAPYDSEEKLYEVARELQESYRPKDGKCYTMLHLIAEGTKDGIEKTITENCTYMGSGENFTGIIAGAIGMLVLEGKVTKKGIFHASDSVLYTDLLEFFSCDDAIKIMRGGVN